jgi:hypothetical protein
MSLGSLRSRYGRDGKIINHMWYRLWVYHMWMIFDKFGHELVRVTRCSKIFEKFGVATLQVWPRNIFAPHFFQTETLPK